MHEVVDRRRVYAEVGEVVDFTALAQKCGMGYSLYRKCFLAYNGMAPLEYQIARHFLKP